jgi:signal transduction histidine kinase
MSAQTWASTRALVANELAGSPTPADASLQRARTLRMPVLAIILAYWLYVTLSNVLYAESMSAGFSAVTGLELFSPMAARITQHLLLLPALLLCYGVSLRTGWRPMWRRLAVQLPLAAAFGLLAQPALELGNLLFMPAHAIHEHQPHAMMGWLTSTGLALWSASATNFLLQYGFGLTLVTAFSLYQRIRDSELRVAAMEKAWSAARLAALRMQLSPHTLFNLLHVIRGQVAWDPRVAQSMIVQLADLLRRLLAAGERDFSRLREELQFVRLYLQLQQQRFIDRLTVELPADEQLPDVWVPSLILQPLAENAVVHGLARHDGRVVVRVEVAIEGEMLVLRVRNDMAPSAPVTSAGIGVANVRERLAVHFGAAAGVQSEPDGAASWTAEVRMPVLRTRPAGAAP